MPTPEDASCTNTRGRHPDYLPGRDFRTSLTFITPPELVFKAGVTTREPEELPLEIRTATSVQVYAAFEGRFFRKPANARNAAD